MKKQYEKPRFGLESFQVDAVLAGSCGDKPFQLNSSIDQCTLMDDRGDYYEDSFFGPACAVKNPEGEDVTVPGFCYQSFDYTVLYLIS